MALAHLSQLETGAHAAAAAAFFLPLSEQPPNRTAVGTVETRLAVHAAASAALPFSHPQSDFWVVVVAGLAALVAAVVAVAVVAAAQHG